MASKVSDPLLLSLGNKINTLRKAHGLTQQQLAEKIGMSTSAVNRIECGQRQPRLVTIQRLADCFNVDPNFLYDFKAPSSAPSRTRNGFVTVPVLAQLPVSAQTAESSLVSSFINVLLPEKKKGFLFAFKMPDMSMSPHILKGDLVVASTGESVYDGCFVAASKEEGSCGVYRFNKTSFGFQFSSCEAGKSFVLKKLDPSPVVATVVMVQREMAGDKR